MKLSGWTPGQDRFAWPTRNEKLGGHSHDLAVRRQPPFRRVAASSLAEAPTRQRATSADIRACIWGQTSLAGIKFPCPEWTVASADAARLTERAAEVDANDIVIDPQVPADISGQLARAPIPSLVPYRAPSPTVVPQPRRRWRRALTSQGRKATTLTAVTAVFFVTTIVAFVGFVIAAAPAAAVLGIVAAIVCIDRFLPTVRAVTAAQRSGWWQQPPTANPYHPAWDGMHAVTAYHRRYVVPGQDMDAEARAVWTRAVDATRALRQSQVVRLGLVDSVQVMTALPYHLWEVAERLARLSALRAEHQEILRGLDANDPDVTTLLPPQRRARELASEDIERRVRQLEVFANLVGQADAAWQREQAVRRLASLNDSHQELLAHVGESPGDDAMAAQISLEVQAIIDHANEAVRQANEAARSFVVP